MGRLKRPIVDSHNLRFSSGSGPTTAARIDEFVEVHISKLLLYHYARVAHRSSSPSQIVAINRIR